MSSLLLTLLPIFAGTAGAVGYAASASTPAVSQALGVLLARPDALVDSWGASAAGVPGPVSMVMAVPAALGAVVGIGSPVTVGAASVAVLSVVAAAIIAVSPAITPVQAPSELLAAAITSATDSLPGDSPTPDTLPSLVTDAHAMPVPPMTAAPSVEQPAVRDARASPTSDRSEDGPLIFHLPFDSSMTTVDLLYADGVPTGGYTPSVSFTTEGSEGSDGFAGSGTGGDVDLLKLVTVPPTDGDDATPLRATLTQPDPRYLPQISGDGAWPGALIVLTDGRDVVVGSGTVDPDGSWRARVSDGLGSGTVRAVQVTVDRISAPSVAMAYRTEEGTSIRQVAGGDADEPDSLSLVFSGMVGASLQREVVDATLLETLTLSDAGEHGETVSVSPGTHTVRVRYVDPTTGDVGAFTEMTFEVP